MPSPKQIPSLIPRQQRTGNPHWRILQRLANGGLPDTTTVSCRGWTIDSWTIGLGLLVAVVCTASWYLQTRPTAMRHTGNVPVPAPVLTSSVPATVGAEPAPEAAQVARIINAATSDKAPLSEQAPTASSTAYNKPERNVSAHRTVHRAEPGKIVIPTDSAKESSDRDAALLAALVAHGNHLPPATGTNRDIVERHASDHTAQLLARCQELGFIEGMLCRSRICADRWDSDAACRRPTKPAIPPAP